MNRQKITGALFSLATALGTSGCMFGTAEPGPVQPVFSCGTPVKTTSKRPDGSTVEIERPMALPELLASGQSLTDAGLFAANTSLTGTGGYGQLESAVGCYGRALTLSPESYEAALGLGVTFIAKARNEPENSRWRLAFLESAKRQLGMAYMIRRGSFEPLYYLAEVAVLEEEYQAAKVILEELKKNGYRVGAVTTLLGYVLETTGDMATAVVNYEIAVREGWPTTSVGFAQARLLALR